MSGRTGILLRRIGILTLFAAGVVSSGTQERHRLDGRWQGAILINGFPLSIGVVFSAAADTLRGTIDIPQQMARGLLLQNVRYSPPGLHFELPASPGLATFDGGVSGDSVSGEFRQAGVKGTFYLVREREEPPVGQAEELFIEHDSVRLAATLSLPSREPRYPACVLIAGSGAHTRDEEVFGFAVFKVLADSLTRAGYAVLRYDKRGVGGSSGDLAASTSEDLAEDPLAAVRYLRVRNDIDPSRIVLVGHSEGGTVAMIAAAKSTGVAAVVLLGGPAVRGDSLILDQIRRLQDLSGIAPSARERALLLERRVFESVRADTGWEMLRLDLESEIRPEVKRQLATVRPEEATNQSLADSVTRNRVDAQIRILRTPWYRHLLQFDPASVIETVRSPVLALYGEKDIQVSVDLNRAPMKEALEKAGNPDSRVEVIPHANHLFQRATTGSIEEYGVLQKEFAPGLLERIEGWLQAVLAEG